MDYDVTIKWDPEACVWIAICDDPCLALEAGSYDALIERVQIALSDLIEDLGKSPCSAINYRTEQFQRRYA